MARIPMVSGFVLIPEGSYVFRITGAKYDETFGKLEVYMETQKGLKHTERFSLMNKNGEPNERALAAFSFFAKTALQDYRMNSIDHTDLVGHYIKAQVVHTTMPSTKDPSKTSTFANLGDKWPANGFEEMGPTPVKPVDLNALLDG